MNRRKLFGILLACALATPVVSYATSTRAYADTAYDLGRVTGKTQQVDIGQISDSNVEVNENTELYIPKPMNVDGSLMTFYGIRVTRFGSDDINAKSLTDFKEKVIINGIDSRIYTTSDSHYKGNGFRFSYSNSRIEMFSGYWDFVDGKNSAVINKGHRFRVRIDYLYKLTDGTDVIINGNHQEFREDLVTQPPNNKLEILQPDNKPVPNITNIYNNKEQTNIWLNKPVRIRVTQQSTKFPSKKIKYWLFHKDVGVYVDDFSSSSDNKVYNSNDLNVLLKRLAQNKKGYMKYDVKNNYEKTTVIDNALGESFYSTDSSDMLKLLHTCMEMNSSGYYVIVSCSEDYVGNYSPISYTEVSFDNKPAVFNQVVFNPLSKTDVHLRAYINGDDNFAGVTKVRYKYWNKGDKEPNYTVNNVVNYTEGTQPYTSTEINNMTQEQKDSLLNVQNFFGFNVPYNKTNGNIYVKLQLIDKSGNVSDEKKIEVPQNSKPQITIEDKDKEIRVGANSFIQFRGKVKDVDKNQMLRVNCDFMDNAMLPNRKTNKLNIFSDGNWQPFSYLFNTNDLKEGIYQNGVKFTVIDTCDDKGEETYTGKVMIDKTPPKTLTQPKLVNISTSPDYQVYKFQYYDNLSGMNTVESNFGNTYKLEPYNGKFDGSDVKLYYAGNFEDRYITYYLYVPTARKPDVPSVLTFTAKDTVGNTSTTNFTLATKGIDSDDAQDFELKTDINTDLKFVNYKEEFPQLHLRSKESDIGLYHTVIIPAKSVSQKFKIMSSKYKDLACSIQCNGKQVYNKNLNDVNGMCQEVDLDLELKPNQYNKVNVVYTDSVGNVVKKDFYNIRLADDFPLYWNWRSHALNLNMFNDLETNFPKPTKDTKVYLTNQFNTSLYSFEGKFKAFDEAIECSNKMNSKKVEDFLRQSSIATYSFFDNNGNRMKGDYTLNLTNTKPELNITLNDNQVMQTISLFGYNFLHTSNFIQHTINNSDLYVMKKSDENYDRFNCKTLTEAIGVAKANSVSSNMAYILPSTGEYLIASEFNLLNKHIGNFNILSYVSGIDRLSMSNVEHSDRFIFNNKILFDTVTKKAIALNLGDCVKGKQYNDKLYIYSNNGIRVYDCNMNLLQSTQACCGGVDICKGKVYLATTKGVLSGTDINKVELNGSYNFIQCVNDNLLIGSSDKLYNYEVSKSLTKVSDKSITRPVTGVYIDDNHDLNVVHDNGSIDLYIQP